MLVMRASQMQAFEKIAVQRFEEGLLEHVRTFFPEHAAALGETALRRVLRYGLQRAESRGLRGERGVYLYLALMFLLGSGFEDDPQLRVLPVLQTAPVPAEPQVQAAAETGTSTASASLSTSSLSTSSGPAPAVAESGLETPDQRIEIIYGQASALLDRIAGPEQTPLPSMLNVWRQPQVYEGLSGPSIGHRLLLLLQMLAPEKYRALGEEALRGLVRLGYENARRQGLSTEPGLMHYVALMFMLGSSFDRDPLYPWAAAVLGDPALQDAAQKSAALREAALAFLGRCLPAQPRRAAQSAAALTRSDQSYRQIIAAASSPARLPQAPL
jgi:hypothetical protein